MRGATFITVDCLKVTKCRNVNWLAEAPESLLHKSHDGSLAKLDLLFSDREHVTSQATFIC